jgi:hypothetical protein
MPQLLLLLTAQWGTFPKESLVESARESWELRLCQDPAKLKSENPVKMQWRLGGKAVCLQGFCYLLRVGRKRIMQLHRAVRQGCAGPFPDERLHNGGRPPNKKLVVDAYLEWVYSNLAEDLAEAVIDGEAAPESEDMDEIETMDDTMDDHQDRDQDYQDCGNKDSDTLTDRRPLVELYEKAPKFLPPLTTAELYETMKIFAAVPEGDLPCYTSLRNAIKSKEWRCLKFRSVSQHAKCTTCSKLNRLRQNANTEEERASVRTLMEGLETWGSGCLLITRHGQKSTAWCCSPALLMVRSASCC